MKKEILLKLIGAAFLSAVVSNAAIAQVASERIRAEAPDRYVVKQGDSLWGISGLFLRSPWLWPQIWKMNKQQIANPHLIYPGDVILMRREADLVTLSIEGSQDSFDGVVEILAPITVETNVAAPIKAISAKTISAFLKFPIVRSEKDESSLAMITGAQDGRLNSAPGSQIYSDTLSGQVGAIYSIYRDRGALIDPDDGKILGIEMAKVGEARISSPATQKAPAILRVTSATHEINVGDKLSVLDRGSDVSYFPKAPDVEIEGKIISINNDMVGGYRSGQPIGTASEGGPLSIAVLNKGSVDGMASGHTFVTIKKEGRIESRSTLGFINGNKVENRKSKIFIRETGVLMVYKVYDRVSYAIMLTGESSISPGDLFRTPTPIE